MGRRRNRRWPHTRAPGSFDLPSQSGPAPFPKPKRQSPILNPWFIYATIEGAFLQIFRLSSSFLVALNSSSDPRTNRQLRMSSSTSLQVRIKFKNELQSLQSFLSVKRDRIKIKNPFSFDRMKRTVLESDLMQ